MKRILFVKVFWVIVIATALFSQNVVAKVYEHSVLQPYLGMEYQYEHIKAHGDYHLLLSSNFPTASIFAGTKICKIFGLEIGYYRSVKTEQELYQFFEFGAVPASGLTSAVSRTRFKGFSVDASYYYYPDPQFSVAAIIGLVTMHESLYVSAQGSTDLAPALSTLTGRNNTVPRLGIGLELLEKNWGVRTRLFWVYTQNMKINASQARILFPALPDKAYLQAVQATAGIFYRF